MAVKFTDLTAFDNSNASPSTDVMAIVVITDDVSYKMTPDEFKATYQSLDLRTTAGLDATLRQVTNSENIAAGTQMYLSTGATAFDGSVSVGKNTAPAYRLDIKAAGATSGTHSVYVVDSGGSNRLFAVRDDGWVFGAASASYGFIASKFSANTVGTEMQFDGNGLLFRYLASSYGRLGFAGSVLGNSTPLASAVLALNSTTQGFAPPRMTTAQKNAISSPATGLMLFDTDLAKLCVYTGAGWETVTSV